MADPVLPRRALVVINPVSGPGRREVDGCCALARHVLERHRFQTEVAVTTATGDARQLSARALADGVSLVVAWGGDGTVNEVGAELTFAPVTVAIVPGGSGNGLARDLGVPLEARAALELAATGGVRVIDAGQVDEDLFFNVAGIGLDATIAARLARPGARRGLPGYVQATMAELPFYRAQPYVVAAGAVRLECPAWFVAVANSRQYGSGAQIAPAARLDDGRLDLIVVEPQPLWRLLRRVPEMFRGSLVPGKGLHMSQFEDARITSSGPIAYHVDGEPRQKGRELTVRVRPGALRVVAA